MENEYLNFEKALKELAKKEGRLLKTACKRFGVETILVNSTRALARYKSSSKKPVFLIYPEDLGLLNLLGNSYRSSKKGRRLFLVNTSYFDGGILEKIISEENPSSGYYNLCILKQNYVFRTWRVVDNQSPVRISYKADDALYGNTDKRTLAELKEKREKDEKEREKAKKRANEEREKQNGLGKKKRRKRRKIKP